jgi:hypothetical protein
LPKGRVSEETRQKACKSNRHMEWAPWGGRLGE